MTRTNHPLECMEGGRYLVYNVSLRQVATQLKDGKELDAYLRQHRGHVCMVEWSDVTGWRASEWAMHAASRLVAIKRVLGHGEGQ